MAIRSGAGTGVVVSLVVFILSTFFLLVLTIVFYSKQTKAIEAQANADNTLATYVKAAERNNDAFKRAEDAAKRENQSVTRYLQEQIEEIMLFTDGGPSTKVEELKTHFQKLGVEPENSVRNRLEDCVRALRDRDAELDRLNTQLKSWGDENAQLRAQKDDLERTHQQRLDELRERLAQYGDSVTDYRREVDDLNADMRSKTDQLSDDYERNRLSLQNEIDTLSEERVVLIRRIDDLERRVRQEILTRPDPSLLVDGKILDQAGRSDEVYIDRGRIHHIVRGMTFEVFADQSSLNLVDGETGRLPRGKASLEVVNVGETTSTCKVVRAVRAQPPVRGDVIANAVYDPNYQFKFLIHGQFDIDGDGRPTESEAEYIRSLVLTWGGVVVSGDNLPGDLDFLVLGNEPPRPSTLPDDPPEHLVDRWVRMRAAYETYNKLMSQAQDAQIPVLNSNRFFILTGYTVR